MIEETVGLKCALCDHTRNFICKKVYEAEKGDFFSCRSIKCAFEGWLYEHKPCQGTALASGDKKEIAGDIKKPHRPLSKKYIFVEEFL